jgi:hypothetical protein
LTSTRPFDLTLDVVLSLCEEPAAPFPKIFPFKDLTDVSVTAIMFPREGFKATAAPVAYDLNLEQNNLQLSVRGSASWAFPSRGTLKLHKYSPGIDERASVCIPTLYVSTKQIAAAREFDLVPVLVG